MLPVKSEAADSVVPEWPGNPVASGLASAPDEATAVTACFFAFLFRVFLTVVTGAAGRAKSDESSVSTVVKEARFRWSVSLTCSLASCASARTGKTPKVIMKIAGMRMKDVSATLRFKVCPPAAFRFACQGHSVRQRGVY